MVRDNALAISGLLVEKVGGKSVHPYQPPGYFAYLNFPAREWQNDQRRRPLPPRPLHPLAAAIPPSEPARLRRPQPRRMHRRSPALQHAAPIAGAAQRPQLRRSRPRLRRGHHAPRRRRSKKTRLRHPAHAIASDHAKPKAKFFSLCSRRTVRITRQSRRRQRKS